ncbi:hypothetical protein EPUS_00176 [Endocarpon pusillum Z07020]|uniref:PIN domain-containing protein n=1 Tax=Endocarpon pusillum (strain Z07020 / HMAS-L-300199) TaxID=1263415 RepID=U1GSL2_ENDPU|nr:uncharacterized protein EPUS_00176 [Endocarpon pusillum Z07020]ERF75383.1 hypothetical protein EPUS_00176 [Endocarpon pusillum Z07020]
MTPRKVFRCVVDDTVLITNISEVKKWILNGSVTLIIPVYTLERLALLKQDASQIGINARQTVEFLDRITEGKDGLPVNAISLQGPTEQYQKWSDVEKHIIAEENEEKADKNTSAVAQASSDDVPPGGGEGQQAPGATNVLSQMLLSKLNFAKEADITPPTSPSSSNERSARSSPEMTAAEPIQENVVVPHSLQPLVNAVVWQANNIENANANRPMPELYFVSNSADAASLMRSFGVNTKNVHQLRQAIGLEDQELKNQSKYLQKHPSPPPPPPPTALETHDTEPKAMFRYEEDSDEEQVVFKPRGRGSGNLSTKSASSSPVMRGSSLAAARPSSSHRYSPRMANSHPNRAEQVKPEVPTEEIDPDSFDRGSFGRANGQRLVLSDGNIHAGFQHRASFHRGGFAPSGPSRGFYRGSPRGVDRGSLRGRGRLYVP